MNEVSCVFHQKCTEIYHFICSFFFNFVYFSPTNFAKNLKVSLSSKTIRYMPLNAENCMQNVKKIVLLWRFCFIKMERIAYIS